MKIASIVEFLRKRLANVGVFVVGLGELEDLTQAANTVGTVFTNEMGRERSAK